tara:strand:+ start:507 stop:1001 length:495 start_codon:yes stop_codon:yes gene_type:complete
MLSACASITARLLTLIALGQACTVDYYVTNEKTNNRNKAERACVALGLTLAEVYSEDCHLALAKKILSRPTSRSRRLGDDDDDDKDDEDKDDDDKDDDDDDAALLSLYQRVAGSQVERCVALGQRPYDDWLRTYQPRHDEQQRRSLPTDGARLRPRPHNLTHTA